MDRRLFYLLPVVVACASIATGCVSVEMPDHMISDTVHAGKDAYRSLRKGKKEDVDKNGKRLKTFQYTRVGHEDETLKMVKDGCLEMAKEKACKELSLKEADLSGIEIVSEEAEISEDHIIVRCTIGIPQHNSLASEGNGQQNANGSIPE